MRYQLAEFTLDIDRRQLLRGEEEIHLSPKAFRLLHLLIEKRPKAISKDELHGELWPSTFVSESNLAGLVAELRGALEDRAREPRFIRTLHGFGYAFCGETTESANRQAPGPRVQQRVIWSGREAQLFEGENVIGRDPADTISIDDSTVSRQHARIDISSGQATLTDNGSKNGTLVNGERLEAPLTLKDGDVIHIGAVRLLFRSVDATQSTMTMRK